MSEVTREELIEILLGMVMQHCHEQSPDVYDSGFIGIDAEAIRALCGEGQMTVVHDGGGRWIQARIGGLLIEHKNDSLLPPDNAANSGERSESE